MPIFEYRCRACGTRFEKLIMPSVSPAQKSLEVLCKDCGSPQVNRLLSVFAVVGPSRPLSDVPETEPGPLRVAAATGDPRRGMCGE